MLKGRSNYLCRQRAAEIDGRGVQQQLDERGPRRRCRRGGRRRRRGCRGPAGRPRPPPPRLGRRDRDRRPGRPALRAAPPGLVDGERRPPRVPGRLPLPLGRHLLRRAGAGGGGGGRRGGGQHPPLRRPPGQRGRRAARARGGGLRRGPRGRGGDDGSPRRRGQPGAVPGPGRRGPDRRRRRRRRPGRRRGRPGRDRSRPALGPPGRAPGCWSTRRARRRARGPTSDGRPPPPARPTTSSSHACWSWPRPGLERLSDAAAPGSERRRPAPDGRGDGGPGPSSAAGHLAGDLARLAARTDDEVAWVDGTSRSPVLRLSPIDVGPLAGRPAVGRGDRRADQRHHPAPAGRAARPRRVPGRRARRGQPLRLPPARPAVRGPPPPRPAPARVRAGDPRGAGGPDHRGRRADPGPVHQPAGDRGRGRGPARPPPLPPARRRGTCPRAGCWRRLRRGRVLLPLRHPRLLAGRRRAGPVAVSW